MLGFPSFVCQNFANIWPTYGARLLKPKPLATRKKLDKAFEETDTFRKIAQDVKAKREALADIQTDLPRDNGNALFVSDRCTS